MKVWWDVSIGGVFVGSIFPTESERYPDLSVSLSGTGFFCVCLGLGIKV